MSKNVRPWLKAYTMSLFDEGELRKPQCLQVTTASEEVQRECPLATIPQNHGHYRKAWWFMVGPVFFGQVLVLSDTKHSVKAHLSRACRDDFAARNPSTSVNTTPAPKKQQPLRTAPTINISAYTRAHKHMRTRSCRPSRAAWSFPNVSVSSR